MDQPKNSKHEPSKNDLVTHIFKVLRVFHEALVLWTLFTITPNTTNIFTTSRSHFSYIGKKEKNNQLSRFLRFDQTFRRFYLEEFIWLSYYIEDVTVLHVYNTLIILIFFIRSFSYS